MVNERKKGDGFPMPADNYKKILIGLVIIVAGFALMTGGGAGSPDTFNYDIFSFRRITLAPAVVLFGFGYVFWAIIRDPEKKRQE
ncbi:MAG: DUF3098 domain-containing protein [Odoribacteraceae bacterium]|jgi:hypothetical protein|nr:DUF3098 domain-containing protein [Odoribacteraceae bacterium]